MAKTRAKPVKRPSEVSCRDCAERSAAMEHALAARDEALLALAVAREELNRLRLAPAVTAVPHAPSGLRGTLLHLGQQVVERAAAVPVALGIRELLVSASQRFSR